jgi:Putative Flp pilus-assembly TadE/G-like
MNERGTVTLWVLGLCVGLMFLAGLSLDLWRAVAVRRELAAMADASATAGANGLDESSLRAGRVELDPARARTFADSALAAYAGSRRLDATRVDTTRVDITAGRITVTLHGHVGFSLLGIFMAGQRFDIEVHASASPEERG